MKENVFTLYDITHKIRQTVDSAFSSSLWLQTEISQISAKPNGHCYLEFIQKQENTDLILARCRAVIWSNRWKMISRFFKENTGQPLSAGMQVLMQVKVEFNEQYGITLIVSEIDPTYTLGDMARRRRMILEHLKEMGIADMNRSLPLPRLLQRIAVISSETAAGWGDFLRQIEDNQYGLRFDVRLFPAVMQGDGVEASIISALEQISEIQDQIDVVVIIRGGGAAADLSGFDTIGLAENVAQFPLPIITGIGHERDDTVIDMISTVRVKTPTAAAEYLLAHQLNELLLIDNLTTRLQRASETYIKQEEKRLSLCEQRVKQCPRYFLQQLHHTLDLYTTKLNSADPQHVLKMGYAVVRKDGKAVKDIKQIDNNDIVEVTVFKGTKTFEVREK